MVTPYQAELYFALQQFRPQYLNLVGGVAGTLQLIGYGHGHIGHFIFTDATTGKKYAAAANANDGQLFIKPSSWASNIPNYSFKIENLSDDLSGTNLGNVKDLFANVYPTALANVNMPFVAVENGAIVSVGEPVTGGVKPLPIAAGSGVAAITPNNPTSQQPTGTPTTKKNWLLPAIIAVTVVVVGIGIWISKQN